ncbi:putative transposase/invertase (TIGR01784 family) [Lactobacillus colini]|uniref:Transposase/invertase (TIGR01784 family) n=1 Tax=Lactobacillus colini TaxID=1819254 RepID=A0ABS4MGE8_9LACO|nr:Rpn family recombination-promoting nuclease/putative transposase [Lactobacillus colini]MBP2058764.1 putative transposase/invertase (TIGR01784 family) [Lactobacillus colini]
MVTSNSLKNWISEDITNDAIFGDVIGRKENCLQLLRAILPQLNIQKIVKIQRQKTISLKMLRKGTRFDVWATDDKGQNFDIEMQTSNDPALLKRSLFYLGRINDEQLLSGKKYGEIKNSYIIFLCTFDPFGYNEAKNEIIQVLERHRSQKLHSGQHIIFFNANALDKSELTPDLRDFLNYMNGKINSSSDFIKRLDKDRRKYINGREWRSFMLDFKQFEAEVKEQGRIDEKIRSIKVMVKTLRSYGISDKEILNTLIKNEGEYFSKDELQKFIQESK